MVKINDLVEVSIGDTNYGFGIVIKFFSISSTYRQLYSVLLIDNPIGVKHEDAKFYEREMINYGQ